MIIFLAEIFPIFSFSLLTYIDDNDDGQFIDDTLLVLMDLRETHTHTLA